VTMKAAPNESAATSTAPAAYPAAAVPQQTPSNNLSDQAPAQQMAETVAVQSQATMATTQDQDQDQGQGRDSTQKQLDLPPAQPQRASNDPIYFYADGDKEMSRAKAPVPQAPENATTAYSIGGPLPVGMTGRSSLPLAAPTWNISSTGRLQRSLDGGKAWEDVDVGNVRLITGERMLAVGVLAKDSPAPEARQENKKEKTDLVARKTPGASAQTFRAVSANAFDVWAGGSGGALYHSVDGGKQWTRVFPTVNSVVLTGDIVSIQFSDSEHGTLTTSVAETWTTTDAGHSWQRH
jgi:Photosynthesis system II assembly factor YCF48